MTTVTIVHHSGFGHTRKQADAVHSGVERNADISASFVLIDAEGNLLVTAWDELLTADAIIFGAPTYMGSVSWQFKKFADASSKPWFGQAWKDKIAAGFTNSANMNGDKHSTLHYMITLSMNQNSEVGWIKRSGSTVRTIVPELHQQLGGSATGGSTCIHATLDPPYNGLPSSWIVGSIGSADRGSSQCSTACFG